MTRAWKREKGARFVKARHSTGRDLSIGSKLGRLRDTLPYPLRALRRPFSFFFTGHFIVSGQEYLTRFVSFRFVSFRAQVIRL